MYFPSWLTYKLRKHLPYNELSLYPFRVFLGSNFKELKVIFFQ